MKPRAFLLFGLVLVLAFFSRFMDRRLSTNRENFFFVPPIAALSAASATHTTLVAYIFFIRGVLDISEPALLGPSRMEYLLKNFKAALALESHIESVYLFAGLVSPRSLEDMVLANRFLAEGMQRRPDDWKIPYWIGLNHLQSGDYSQAVYFYRIAAAKPDSPNFLKTNLAYLYYRSGETDAGLLYLQALLVSVKDARVTELIERKIAWLKTIVFLQNAVKEYRQRYGDWPRDLGQMQDKGLLANVPLSTFGNRFFLEPPKEGKAPRVKSRQQWGN